MSGDAETENRRLKCDALILVVDDEPIVGEVVKLHLRRQGYGNVVALTDSTLALEWIDRNRPTLVLLDLSMPRIGGIDILMHLKQDPALREIPVLVITASCDPEIRGRVIGLGAVGIVDKPIDADDLVRLASAAISARAI